MNTQTRIDWLSYTLLGFEGSSAKYVIEETIRTFSRGFLAGLGANSKYLTLDNTFKQTHHKPYSWAVTFNELQGLVIMGSPYRNECVVEFQGSFCASYPDAVMSMAIEAKDAVTRLDIACDVQTDTLPENAVKGHTLKTHSFLTSSKGDTVYLGSQKSETFARVYRYARPHPRFDLLRSEVVYKRDHAKRVCEAFSRGLTPIEVISDWWVKVGLKWWIDNAELTHVPDGKLLSGVRSSGGKMADSKRYWLSMQVNPAIEKMFDAGMSLDEVMGCLKSIAVRVGYPTSLPD